MPEFIKQLRQIKDLENLILIVITKEQGCSIGLSALEAGADDYLSIPLVDKELAIRVQVHLNKRKKI